MGFYEDGRDSERNLDFENSVTNGILGSIPAALVGGPVGAIASIAVGIFSGVRREKQRENARWKVISAEADRRYRRAKAIDEWDKINTSELYEQLHESEEKRFDLFQRIKPREIRVVMYSSGKGTFDYCRGYSEDIPMDYYEDGKKKHGVTHVITIRDFFCKFHDKIDEFERVRFNNLGISTFDAYLIDNEFYFIRDNNDFPEGKPL